MGDRCTGTCCHEFTLPLSPLEVERMKTAIAAGEKTYLDDGGQSRCVAEDGAFITDMVIHLGYYRSKNYPDEVKKHHHYTCRHFDAQAGNCTAYGQRPRMCSDFPYGKPCPYKSCSWDAGRQGAHPPRPPAGKYALSGPVDISVAEAQP